jgi:outer membrane protein assembly factor BamB
MAPLLRILLFAAALPLHAEVEADRYWPHWRGPRNDGVAPFADPPVTWSEDANVRWRLPLAGEGHSTPVVWGDILYFTQAVPVGEKREPLPETAEGAHDFRLVDREYDFRLTAVHVADGKAIWERTLRRALPHEGGYVTGSYASMSPVTDGRSIYAYFGSQGVYALDLEGKVLWQRHLGEMRTHHGHGEGSSPALHGDTLVVNWDQEKDSFVIALDARTGETRWRTPRDEITSWSTPLIVEHEGRRQVVIAATKKIRSYDLETGTLLWECGGLSRNVVASPVARDGMVFVSNSYEWQVLMGIHLAGARGDITKSDRVAWTIRRQTSYVASPVLLGDTLFYMGHLSGVITGVEARTGALKHPTFRLEGIRNVWASPLAANGRIYVCDQSGSTLVLKVGATLEPLALNKLDDRFTASPVAVGEDLFLRGGKFLYGLREATRK